MIKHCFCCSEKIEANPSNMIRNMIDHKFYYFCSKKCLKLLRRYLTDFNKLEATKDKISSFRFDKMMDNSKK